VGRPLAIGRLTLPHRLVMAPMAGITTQPFRRSVRRWGAGLVHTEMISSHGIAYGNRRTIDYLTCGDDEHPIGFQLFGAVPDMLARAAAVCVESGADLVDLNMACPVRKVVKTGAGAALMGTPELAEACVRAAVAAVAGAVPVTVKVRSGVRGGGAGGRGGGAAPRPPPPPPPPAPPRSRSTRERRPSSIAATPITASRSLWPPTSTCR
jgi:tRNA-dihydrouridine synthase B